jgi:hypothetical protein
MAKSFRPTNHGEPAEQVQQSVIRGNRGKCELVLCTARWQGDSLYLNLHFPSTASAAVITSSSGLLMQCSVSFAPSDNIFSRSITAGSCSGK